MTGHKIPKQFKYLDDQYLENRQIVTNPVSYFQILTKNLERRLGLKNSHYSN